MFHHGLLGIEYLMNCDFSFAEEYFKCELNHEGVMTLCAYGTQKRLLENNKGKENHLAREWYNVHEAILRSNENT